MAERRHESIAAGRVHETGFAFNAPIEGGVRIGEALHGLAELVPFARDQDRGVCA